MTFAEEGQPPSNDPEEWQDTHTAQCACNSATVPLIKESLKSFKIKKVYETKIIRCCKLHVLQIAYVPNCAFSKLHVFQISPVPKCMYCKYKMLQSEKNL